MPEVLIGGNPDFWLTKMLEKWGADMNAFTPDALVEYKRCFRDPKSIHATCEDYRAGNTIDVTHDIQDRDQQIACPVLVLWGDGRDPLARIRSSTSGVSVQATCRESRSNAVISCRRSNLRRPHASFFNFFRLEPRLRPGKRTNQRAHSGGIKPGTGWANDRRRLEKIFMPNDGKKSESNPAPERPQFFVRYRASMLRRLRTYFLTGIVATAPIGLTLYLSWVLVKFVDRLVTPSIPAQYNPNTYVPFDIPGLGVIVAIILLTFIGFITANFLGRQIVALGESVVDRMPVIRSVYGALKQIFETVLAQSSRSFREVVLIEYPRRGIWAVGFVTSETLGEIQNVKEDELVNVFLPTTPNPTSGFLLFVPRQDLITLHMTVEEGIKMVISGGIVTPPDPRPRAVIDARGPETAEAPHEPDEHQKAG